MNKIVLITTIPITLNFFQGQIGYLKQKGFDVNAISSPGSILNEIAKRERISVFPIQMYRSITPFRDITALIKMSLLFQRLRPVIVHAHTPKGGLLGVIAAKMAKVPVIIYTIHGLPFLTSSGIKRRILFLSEKICCKFAHQIFAVSRANMKVAIDCGICSDRKIKIIAYGSINGVDAENRYNPRKISYKEIDEIKKSYGITKNNIVIGFVGRIVRDKGIIELYDAWQSLKKKYNINLFIIGQEEEKDPVPPNYIKSLKKDSRVIFTGRVSDPMPYYAAMDILILPTYREGFPVTLLEAAAMEIPVVATNVDGCPEAVADGVTGLLIPPRDSQALALAIEKLIINPELRRQMGNAGRERVLRDFRPQIIWEELYRHYCKLINEKGLHL